ncbi:hypothetical protein PVAND_000260 [Polypedilum vanderplanki]|uniref:Uncharacterized protein n=1 Tax=Polypedilum vanderplanki TaxID=319348 RepID=A0A9J6BKD6_POLVA|nr:hypothetical protein PVAND_000260 [Polypedilum vanderplanki]
MKTVSKNCSIVVVKPGFASASYKLQVFCCTFPPGCSFNKFPMASLNTQVSKQVLRSWKATKYGAAASDTLA